MPDKIAGKCKQEGCTVETDGRCLEGLKHEECPHFIAVDESDAETSPGEEKSVEKDNESSSAINFYDGEGLDGVSMVDITRAVPTRLIFIAGASGSGKTTLLASIYESFQRGSFAGYIFAGSKTLPGYEKKCHLARISSGMIMPDTERTKMGSDESVLHLCVRVEDISMKPQHILFTDLSGETFAKVKDSIQECKKLTLLKHADQFVLLIDGEKLTKPEQRHEAHDEAQMILRSCLDSNMLEKDSYVDVVITKWDLISTVSDKNDKEKVGRFIDHITKELSNNFEKRIARLRFFNIAARPDPRCKANLEPAYGVKNIFQSWVGDKKPYNLTLPKENRPHSAREFDMYLYKV